MISQEGATSLNSSSNRTTLFQAAAQNFVYLRLADAAIKTFLVALFIFPVMNLARFSVNLLTKQHSLLALVLTAVFTLSAGFLARKLSTSEKALDRWLKESAARVPVYAFGISCLIARVFGNSPSPRDSWSDASVLRVCRDSFVLALTIALLQVVIILRYISPISISTSSCMTPSLFCLEDVRSHLYCLVSSRQNIGGAPHDEQRGIQCAEAFATAFLDSPSESKCRADRRYVLFRARKTINSTANSELLIACFTFASGWNADIARGPTLRTSFG